MIFSFNMFCIYHQINNNNNKIINFTFNKKKLNFHNFSIFSTLNSILSTSISSSSCDCFNFSRKQFHFIFLSFIFPLIFIVIFLLFFLVTCVIIVINSTYMILLTCFSPSLNFVKFYHFLRNMMINKHKMTLLINSYSYQVHFVKKSNQNCFYIFCSLFTLTHYRFINI